MADQEGGYNHPWLNMFSNGDFFVMMGSSIISLVGGGGINVDCNSLIFPGSGPF